MQFMYVYGNGHNWETETILPTCEEQGNDHKVCSVCGKEMTLENVKSLNYCKSLCKASTRQSGLLCLASVRHAVENAVNKNTESDCWPNLGEVCFQLGKRKPCQPFNTFFYERKN